MTDSLIVTIGGQLQRVLGTFTALALRWWLDPARLGVYTGLRLCLDNTNRSSLGVGLGAVQEIAILRAQGREPEARRIANVAQTTNTLTCLAYAVGLVAWSLSGARSRANDPLAAEWTWGLIAVAGLAILKRQEAFRIAVLRAHQKFALTARVDLLEALVSAPAVGIGLIVAGFWGLLAAVGLIVAAKIAYLQWNEPSMFAWTWDPRMAVRLMGIGLPILANTAAFGCVVGMDRALILGVLPDGARAAGLYSIALLGTSWSLDLAGRVVLVLYPYFQTALGRSGDPDEVARQAARATEYLAPVLAVGGSVAYVIGPVFLGLLLPRYAEGLPALRPLLPGVVLLGLAWPARQVLIAIGRPYRLLVATLLGLLIVAGAGLWGAWTSGIVGVAWGMTAGYAAVFLLSDASAFLWSCGIFGWLTHLGRLAMTLIGLGASALLAAHLEVRTGSAIGDGAVRLLILLVGMLAISFCWTRVHALTFRGLFLTLRQGGPAALPME